MSAARKSRKGSALWLVAAMVLGVAAVPAVLAPESASAKSGQGGGLVLLQWQSPTLANPYLSQSTKDLLASSPVLEPLAEVAPDGTLVPALATKIPTQANGGISDDLTQITWTLQSGVLWSDGSPLTADDVVFTWEYCSNEATGCASFSFGNVASVVAVGDGKVTINFTDPTPYPFVPFVGYTSPIIQRAQFQDCVGAPAQGCTDQNMMPIGTGPYVVTEFLSGDTVFYEHNPSYRLVSESKPFFGTVEIRGASDPESAASAVLEKGEADYAWNLQVAPEVLRAMEAAGNGEVVAAFTSNVEHINLNQTDPDGSPPSDYNGGANPNPYFFENQVLHDALSIAISRTEIVEVGYGFTDEPTCNMWTAGAQNSPNNDSCLTQDIAGANALLDAEGYVDTDNDGVRETPDGLPLEFDFVTSTNTVRQATQDIIKANWAEIGVVANMRNEDAGLFFSGIWKFFTDMEMFTNGPVSPDAQGYLAGWTTSQIPESTNNWAGDNIVRLASPEFDDLHTQLSATPYGDPTRDDRVIQLNDIIVDYSTIPLVNRGNVSAFANSIEGQGDLNGWDSEYWNIEDWTRASDGFIDIDGNIFENAIEWLADQGITKGCNPPVNDKFCPNDNVTRGEMAVFLVRAMGYKDNGGGNLFIDDDGLFYENAADRLFTAGVTRAATRRSTTSTAGNGT